MAKAKTTFADVKNTACWIGVILTMILTYALAIALYGRTLVEWWEPLGVALAGALVLWLLLRRWWIRAWQGTSVYLILLAHMVFMTGVMLAAVLALNYWCVDEATLHPEQVTVERRYSETRYRSQRTGRGRYRQGTPYKVYFLDLRFENGRRKEVEVSLGRYNRIRSGSEISLELETGLLGYPVIKGPI